MVVEDDELLGGENEFIVSTAVVFVAARSSNLAKDASFCGVRGACDGSLELTRPKGRPVKA